MASQEQFEFADHHNSLIRQIEGIRAASADVNSQSDPASRNGALHTAIRRVGFLGPVIVLVFAVAVAWHLDRAGLNFSQYLFTQPLTSAASIVGVAILAGAAILLAGGALFFSTMQLRKLENASRELGSHLAQSEEIVARIRKHRAAYENDISREQSEDFSDNEGRNSNLQIKEIIAYYEEKALGK